MTKAAIENLRTHLAAPLPDGETEEPARVNHTLNSYIANCPTKRSVNVPRESLESIAASIAAQAAEIAELRRSCGLLVADAEKCCDRIEQLEAERDAAAAVIRKQGEK